MKILLRTIPVSNINGYEHILYAITNCGDKEVQQLVERINPDFSREYGTSYRNKFIIIVSYSQIT
jgi:hypothetical protein